MKFRSLTKGTKRANNKLSVTLSLLFALLKRLCFKTNLIIYTTTVGFIISPMNINDYIQVLIYQF